MEPFVTRSGWVDAESKIHRQCFSQHRDLMDVAVTVSTVLLSPRFYPMKQGPHLLPMSSGQRCMSLRHVASLSQGWHDKKPHSEQLLCHLIYRLR